MVKSCGSLPPTVGVGRVNRYSANSTGGNSSRYRLASPTTRQARSPEVPATGTGDWIWGAAGLIGAEAVLMKGSNLALKLSCEPALYIVQGEFRLTLSTYSLAG